MLPCAGTPDNAPTRALASRRRLPKPRPLIVQVISICGAQTCHLGPVGSGAPSVVGRTIGRNGRDRPCVTSVGCTLSRDLFSDIGPYATTFGEETMVTKDAEPDIARRTQ